MICARARTSFIKAMQNNINTIPKLFFVVPCFNEEECIEKMARILIDKCETLEREEKISPDSGILFVDDGSSDNSWSLIKEINAKYAIVKGISLNRNYGHQTALYSGLLEVKDKCDIAISLDADGQHDISAVDLMLAAYDDGNDIACAVRKSSGGEGVAKNITSNLYYRLLRLFGIKLIKGHADYRLVSSEAILQLEALQKKVLVLRGDFLKLPLRYTAVEYNCLERMAGESKYSIKKMMRLALNGLASNGILTFAGKENADFEISERI